MIDPNSEITYGFLWLVIIAVFTLFVMGGLLIWAIIKVRHEKSPTMLIVALGVITLVTILAFALTKQNVLATLAGTGLGALAGSLTNVLTKKDSDENGKEL